MESWLVRKYHSWKRCRHIPKRFRRLNDYLISLCYKLVELLILLVYRFLHYGLVEYEIAISFQKWRLTTVEKVTKGQQDFKIFLQPEFSWFDTQSLWYHTDFPEVVFVEAKSLIYFKDNKLL